ncbi:MAG: TIGR03067 domain-containing protein [Isosphaeraceae bacterium]|nr:TIGR03067 domain-containing protein [Isosphaeraceae bacterium]
MMRPISRIMTVAMVLIAGTIARGDEKPTGDLAKLQGAWTGLGGPSRNVPFTLTVDGTKLVFEFEIQGEVRKVEGRIRLDEKAEPRTLDFHGFTSPNGDAIPENQGIYRLEDDRLTVCSGGPGNPRPTEFKAGADGPPNLQVLTRVAKAGEPKPVDAALKPFQGNWKTKLRDLEITLSIVDDKVSAEYVDPDGNTAKLDGEIVVNAAVTPKTIDFVKFHRDADAPMPDNLGIFTVGEGEITICLGGAGNPRPTEFKNEEGGATIITLKKAP